jgi:uncharacterized protein YjbI with pentapeptide repeats
MSNDLRLSSSKPFPESNKLSSIKINYRDFTKALGQPDVDLTFGEWDSLASESVEALTALGILVGANEIAWLLVYRSILQAMKNLVDENIAKKAEIVAENFKPEELQLAIDRALENSSFLVDREFFAHPDKASMVGLIQPPFISWLIDSGVVATEAEAISQRLPIYFAAALHTEWGDRPQDYGALKEKLDTPFTQANDRAQAWARYSVWLQKQVEEPLFLEAFSLKQVFVPLRAYYHQKISEPGERRHNEQGEGKRQTERIVVNLELELTNWLSQAKKEDAIRLISGGSGSGKSSLTKMFAARLASEGNIPTLFVPLHHFEPSDDLIEAVGRFLKLDGFLNFNPLETEYREERLLIIFDGLDELVIQGKVGEKTAVDFVRKVQRQVNQINQQKAYVQVLISGRELVVQTNEGDFRKEGQILHVLPYWLPQDDHQHYVDPEQLLVQDQRQLWWKYYGRASGNGLTGLPSQIDRGNLNEITAQPLLNYLVALSLHNGQIEFAEITNLNAVYDNLFRSVYATGWDSQHSDIQDIEEKDFVRILEEIALANWHSHGQTTTVKAIESHCIYDGLKELLNRSNVTKLLTNFYFRHNGNDNDGDKTFEFTHKNFCEYLTAKRIIREVRLIHEKLMIRKSDPNEGWDEGEALVRWVELCGLTTMDEYLFNFIVDEVQLHYQPNSNEVCEWQETFCSLIGFMLRHGLPMEKLSPRPSYQEEFRQALNTEDSLLAVLGAFQSSTQVTSNIDFPTPNAFGILLARLGGKRIFRSNPVSFHCLSYLNLSGCLLIASDLSGADLTRANLSGANLSGANLIKANLSEATLSETNLIKANLSGANLTKANLSEANLSEATLVKANLIKANLSGAILTKANLRGANFNKATLVKTNLIKANLIKADLRGAILRGAILRGANFSGADLSAANLGGANFSGTNLIKANLIKANLNKANLSETHLSGANFSGANLVGADLSGANFSGANFSGANLIKANLSEADLSGANLIKADLSGANLLTTKNLTIEQVNSTKSLQNAMLPRTI